MAKPWEQYSKEMFNEFGYLATWTPGVPLKLGDVGTIKDYRFSRVTTLKNLGIPFEVREDTTKENQDHVSDTGVSIAFKAAGKIPQAGSVLSQAEAGFTIDFKKSNSTLYQALGCVSPSIEDQKAVGDVVLKLYNQGQWNVDWIVITEIVIADSATVLISQKSNAKIELSVTGKITTGTISIADAKAGLEIAFFRDMETKLVSKEGLTPLFAAKAIKSNGPIGPFPRLRVFDKEAPNQSRAREDLYFGYVGYDYKDGQGTDVDAEAT